MDSILKFTLITNRNYTNDLTMWELCTSKVFSDFDFRIVNRLFINYDFSLVYFKSALNIVLGT